MTSTTRAAGIATGLALLASMTVGCGGGSTSSEPMVTTIAGVAWTSGHDDTGPGTPATFSQPSGIAVDHDGNVFVADTYNSTIRKLTPGAGGSYTVSTIAGTAGSTGTTNAAGAAARFDHPVGIAVDGAGDLFVADTNNGRIRKLTWNASTSAYDVTTIASSLDYPQGVTLDAGGNLYVSDTNAATIVKLTRAGATYTASVIAGAEDQTGTDDGDGLTQARFSYPTGISIDGSGNLYVMDSNKHTVRKLTPGTSGYTVSTIAGLAGESGYVDAVGSAARFSTPRGIVAAPSGDVLYVADTNNFLLRTITRQGSAYSVARLAGVYNNSGPVDGPASKAQISGPYAIARDSDGNLYVADLPASVIRKVTF